MGHGSFLRAGFFCSSLQGISELTLRSFQNLLHRSLEKSEELKALKIL